MSAGISYMYKLSGGCEVMKRCHNCAYLAEDFENRGFGRRTGRSASMYECRKHPDETARKNWKETYTACQFFEEVKEKTVFVESADGQLSFL